MPNKHDIAIPDVDEFMRSSSFLPVSGKILWRETKLAETRGQSEQAFSGRRVPVLTLILVLEAWQQAHYLLLSHSAGGNRGHSQTSSFRDASG